MAKYTIGIDYGTLSGRILLVDVQDGKEIGVKEVSYKHGVMDEFMPDGKTKLPLDTALQHPQDYLDVLYKIPNLIKECKINKEDIIGIGVDFTACTILPIDKNNEPLCFKEEFKNRKHAYVKLWKDHSSQDEANKLNKIAINKGKSFIKRYGGKISSEWLVPKVMKLIEEDEEIYNNSYRIIEALDWIILKLTGIESRSICSAGFKGMWSKESGYESKEFLSELDSRLENFTEEKLSNNIKRLDECAGTLTKEMADKLNLKEGIKIATGIVDAHAALPALGIVGPGKMLMIMGTSTCHIMMDNKERFIDGVSGVVEDGIIPGYYAYEAGQACVGDHFDWFVRNGVPKEYEYEAKNKNINIHELLCEKVKDQKPGESGLIALDWFNGNRSILTDADLTGAIIGYTLLTKPEEIYRVLIEGTAFGTKIIIDAFENEGVNIEEIYAAGGIAQKNEMMMQIYSDVLNKEINISDSNQASALGSAILAAAIAGKENGGYDNICEASKYMARKKEKTYKPIEENVKLYSRLFKEYKILHDYFGKGENNVMKRLKNLKNELI
ncbi:ribulokinase [Clostridium sp. Ade.TY]|uniref:ribulokinase n=1 Tax=Clostridium sp. Ade.TY TaxID=1391647 RepID=UPI000405D359|nr:ribulokinase [Clostridium sp. Ade.TY]